MISSYCLFPNNEYDKNLQSIINQHISITHLGKLSKSQLYELMSTSEYWLYPSNWTETSCITAMEMLMSEVICLYYPLAGLTDTMDNHGLQIKAWK